MRFSQIKQILKSKTVGIAGCGGLGSNCAVALARVGVGTIVIADFDIIEESNLNRQYYFWDQIGKPKANTLKTNIERINPKTKVIVQNVFLTEENVPEVFKNCDVIVEAFDKTDAKEMIIKTVIKTFPDKYLVCGIGIAGWGKNNEIKEQKYDKVIVCGDEKNEISENNPPLAPRVGIVSNMQANAVLEILLNEKK
ncbi:MAG: sulfur carrier protein ThiS adenylyltransferase ThiF [Bacteroidales bacterium]|nr:sulfur carrier protein ThiS adenylyltransferase ThiF [Bacteroidales bacterium]